MLARSVLTLLRPWRAVSPVHYDVCIIGAGPAGIAAALRAVDYRKTVCLVERGKVGGADLWNGTLSSKTLWEFANYLARVNNSHARRLYGHSMSSYVELDEARMQQCVRQVSQTRERQILAALSATQIQMYFGQASFMSDTELHVTNRATQEYRTISADYYIIATGAAPKQHAFAQIDGRNVVNSNQVMHLPLPRRLVVVGGGPLGCEFASIFAGLGKTTEVALLDKAPNILPGEDEDIVRCVEQHMASAGIVVHHNSLLYDLQVCKKCASVDGLSPVAQATPPASTPTSNLASTPVCGEYRSKANTGSDEVTQTASIIKTAVSTQSTTDVADTIVQYTVLHRANKTLVNYTADVALIAVGREPSYKGLGLEHTSLKVTDGRLVADENGRCANAPHIYVVGDAISTVQLVSMAEMQGKAALDCIYGATASSCVNPFTTRMPMSRAGVTSLALPSMVTPPMMASSMARVAFLTKAVAAVGLNETACRRFNIAYIAATVGYEAISRTIAADETDGFLKVVVSSHGTRPLLGVRAVGMNASTLVNLGTLAIQRTYTVSDLANMLTAYPAVSQALQECLRAITVYNVGHIGSSLIGRVRVTEWAPENYGRGRAYQKEETRRGRRQTIT